MTTKPHLEPGSEIVIPVIEEQLEIDKRVKETARVRVEKTIREEPVTIDEALHSEEYEVSRVPVNQLLDEAPAPRQDGDTLVLPVVKEEIVVMRRYLLVEEVHITRKLHVTQDRREFVIRREHVEVHRDAGSEEG